MGYTLFYIDDYLYYLCSHIRIFSDEYSENMRDMGVFEISAHRGIPKLAPENTIPSLLLALRSEADYIEFDVHRTLDGKLVVIHDSSLRRITNGSGIVEFLPYKYLRRLDAGFWFSDRFRGTHIPLLHEALELLSPWPKRIIIDIKSRNATTKILDVVSEFGIENKVIIASRIISELLVAKEKADSIQRMLISETIPDAMKMANLIEPNIVAPTRKDSVWERDIEYAHEQGIRINIGIINDPIEASIFSKIGADILTTDNAYLLAKVRKIGLQRKTFKNMEKPLSNSLFCL